MLMISGRTLTVATAAMRASGLMPFDFAYLPELTADVDVRSQHVGLTASSI